MDTRGDSTSSDDLESELDREEELDHSHGDDDSSTQRAQSDANTDSSSQLLAEQHIESTAWVSSIQSPLEPLQEARDMSSVVGRTADAVKQRPRPEQTPGISDTLQSRGLADNADV